MTNLIKEINDRALVDKLHNASIEVSDAINDLGKKIKKYNRVVNEIKKAEGIGNDNQNKSGNRFGAQARPAIRKQVQ